MWTERLLKATGWTDQRLTLSWHDVESALQLELPGDYKRLCEAFGRGEFCASYVLKSVGDGTGIDMLNSWQVELRFAPEPGSEDERDSVYAPHASRDPRARRHRSTRRTPTPREGANARLPRIRSTCGR
ncbi:hypothetical protein ACH41E_32490 [Streptomyces sp. NPDC020412]|uniref:hypothetical protein n=1 Tax=Streptomyces sp. NPDC020412 TaxID=3365073 RepID=UPI0037891F57